jgi:predicted Mrr-cat superfamily restriction endonuclease
MPEVYCVRADFGAYTELFIKGGYAAIGWLHRSDLSKVKTKDALYPLYKQEHPEDTSNIVIGQQVGQIARFLFDIQPGDYVVTPAADTQWLHYGVMEAGNSYYFDAGGDGCRFNHRRRVKWAAERINRTVFSVPLQNTLRSSLTVFYISQRDEFFANIGKKEFVARESTMPVIDSYEVVLNQVLELDPREFEILIKHLLEALGFEGAEHTGKTGDGGVDATGTLDVDNFAKIKVYVQAKRFKLGQKIAPNTVKQLRQAIPFGGQGAFITTADYQPAAREVADEAGFPRIGLINGRQLVDLLIKHWSDIPQEFKDKLGLKPGLVKA